MHPDQIGPYRIDRKIGSGGMGNVYHGIHTETAQTAAVKVLPASLAREQGFIQRFSREIRALKKLTSRHIVELFDDGSTDDGSWYYAMEFVDGETLTTLITRRQKLPWTEVSDITLQIAAALKAAHDAGVVHRDIKPSNLMVTSDGIVKLTDFGVAHMFATTRLTRTGGVVGTAEYMSPEQARGQRATKRSDLYSLGAVMYAMLTGQPPFTGKNVTEILHKQQFSQIEKPRHYAPETPRLFEDLVCQLLEKKQEQRIPDALVLSRRLEQIRKRVEFAERHQDGEITSGAAAVYGRPPTEGAAATGDAQAVHRPGSATLVRDILRREVASRTDKSRLASLFDNTIVLIAMLIIVIALGVYLTWNATPTALEQLANAKAIMATEATPAWLRARDILRKLQRSRTLPDHSNDIEQLIRRASQYEFCRSLERAAPTDESRESEIQRLVRRAFDRFAHGEVHQARTDLKSVAVLLGNSEQDMYLGDFIESTLEQWQGDTNLRGRHQLLAEVSKEAREAVGNPDTAKTAIALLEATLSLYLEDAVVVDEIEECRQLLATIRSEAAEE